MALPTTYDCRYDGVIATCTTIVRDAVKGPPHAEKASGLSGLPVFAECNRVIGQLRAALSKRHPVVGGVMSVADAQAKIDAGADVVQIYSGLIYKG